MHTYGHYRPVAHSAIVDSLDAGRAAAAAAAAASASCPSLVQHSGNSNASAYSGLNSSFTGFALPNTTVYPEIALFSQFGQLFPQYTDSGQNQAQGQQRQQQQSQPAPHHSSSHLSILQQQSTQSLPHKPTLSGLSGLSGLSALSGEDNPSRGKTRSSDSRSSSAYASRHQAAEQRRRTRINERLELLRRMVPHAERANTACFLEEVIKYIDTLKRRNSELEGAVQKLLPSTGREPEKPVEVELPAQAPAGRSGEGGVEESDLQDLPSTKAAQTTAEEGPCAPVAPDGAGPKGDAVSTIQSLLAGYSSIPTAAPRKSTSQSPASSEESGVPFKKRKMLVL